VRLEILQGIYQGEVSRDLIMCRWLQENFRLGSGRLSIVGVGDLVEGSLGYGGGRERRRGVQLLEEGAAK
jgi:hypothetical protein